MSPEICGAERYTVYSDIWSLGCIVYELCAREPPFNAKTHLELIQKIKAGRVPRIPNVYSGELQKVIDSCLRVNPNQRPDTAELLNLPIVKLMRKEQEVVKMGQHMKAEKEKFANALQDMSLRMTRIEEEKQNARVVIDAELRKEWEVKARSEIDRQVQAEAERLHNLFEEEVAKRVAIEVQRQLAANPQPARSSTPTMTENDIHLLAEEPRELSNGVSTSTADSLSDFPSQTDISSLSLESPTASTSSFKPQKRPSRTPFARAKTMFNQNTVVNSPKDIHMAEPSPAPNSMASLNLSPRRVQRKNIFADKWVPTIPSSPSSVPMEGTELLGDDDDDLPTLPSPTRPRSAMQDPFKALEATTKPVLKPTQPRLTSAPNLHRLGPTTMRQRPTSTVPVVATSPTRRKSKMPVSNDAGSPVRRGLAAPSDTRGSSNSEGALKSKKGNEEMRVAAMRNNLQGRTLLELAQGKATNIATSSKGEDIVIAASRRKRTPLDDEPAHWDPEIDEMPSPFLARGTKTMGRGILPVR